MPIDIASGQVELDRVDFVLPGRVPVSWTRSYRSRLLDKPVGPLGRGWTSSWFPSLSKTGSAWQFTSRDGSVNVFPDPANEVQSGHIVRLLGSFMEIFARGGEICIAEWDVESGEIHTCVFEPSPVSSAHWLSAIENVNGDRVELGRSQTGVATSLHQVIEQRTLSINYTPRGQVESILLDSGELNVPLVGYEYDDVGNLIAAFNSRGFAHRYDYDTQSRLQRELLPDGAVYTYRYDSQNRCVHFTGLDRYNEKKLKFIDPVSTTIVTNSHGSKKVFKANSAGQIESETTPIGATCQTKYDCFGRIIELIDELGASTTYTYDASGNRESVTDAMGNVTKFEFNRHHLPTSITDATKQVWKREYNQQQRLTAIENPLGDRWQVRYDLDGNPIAITKPTGVIQKRKFERGQLVSATDFLGNESTFRWDSLGRLFSRTDASGATTQIRYDGSGNPTEVVQADGSSLKATYDAGENLSSFTNGKGESIKYRYGACKRLLERVDALGRSVYYEWGTEREELNSIVNQNGERFSYTRDDAGRVIMERSFDGREHRFAYDRAGRVTAFTNGIGETVRYRHDLMGRLIEQILPTGEKTTFEFDSLGRLVVAANPDAILGFEYDRSGRLVLEAQNENWVQTEYDPDGEVIRTLTNLDHEVEYELNPNGQVKKLTMANKQSLLFARDARGLEVGRQMPGNIQLKQCHDRMGRVIEQRLSKMDFQRSLSPGDMGDTFKLADADMVQRSFAYDPDGLVLAINDGYWGISAHTYNLGQQLTHTLRDKGISESFDYDSTGNLIRKQQQSADIIVAEEFVFSTGNRLQRHGDITYEHDADGRLIRKTVTVSSSSPQVWEYHWDAQGQLRRLRSPDGDEWQYQYDPFSRRIKKTGPNGSEEFIWKANTIAHNIAQDGLNTAWLFEGDGFAPVAKIENEVVSFVINDHLGTPREMVCARKPIIRGEPFPTWDGVSYERFEQARNRCPIRFQGQWHDDESGLAYNRFRYYCPNTGHFCSPDPLRTAGGLNLYSYVSDPVNLVDPFGLTPTSTCGDAAPVEPGVPPTTVLPSSGSVFVVSPGGVVIVTPAGSTGPTPVINPAGRTTGFAFTGGAGGPGLDPRTSGVRIMDPTPPKGASPGYPSGYAAYNNAGGQGVNPQTGRTVPNSDPSRHIPL